MAEATLNVTPKEALMLAAAYVSLDPAPKPDYDFIARVAGYKNESTAAAMFGPLKRRVVKEIEAIKSGAPLPAPTPKRKRKAKAKDEAEGGDEDVKPAKRAKKNKAASDVQAGAMPVAHTFVKHEHVTGDDNEEEDDEEDDRSPGFFKDALQGLEDDV